MQFVSVDGCNSATLPVLSDVPQGLVCCFSAISTMLQQLSHLIVNMFAGDVALYCVIRTRAN